MINHAGKGICSPESFSIASSATTLSNSSPSLSSIGKMLKEIISDQNIIKEQLSRLQSSSSSSSSSNDFVDHTETLLTSKIDESVDSFNDSYTPKSKPSIKKKWVPIEDLTNEIQLVNESRGNYRIYTSCMIEDD